MRGGRVIPIFARTRATLLSVVALFGVTIYFIPMPRIIIKDDESADINPVIVFTFTTINLVIDFIYIGAALNSWKRANVGVPLLKAATLTIQRKRWIAHQLRNVLHLELHSVSLESDASHEGLLRLRASESAVAAAASQNLNMASAYVHILADTLRTIGVLTSALLVWFGHLPGAVTDAWASLIVSVIVLLTGFIVVREAVGVSTFSFKGVFCPCCLSASQERGEVLLIATQSTSLENLAVL